MAATGRSAGSVRWPPVRGQARRTPAVTATFGSQNAAAGMDGLAAARQRARHWDGSTGGPASGAGARGAAAPLPSHAAGRSTMIRLRAAPEDAGHGDDETDGQTTLMRAP